MKKAAIIFFFIILVITFSLKIYHLTLPVNMNSDDLYSINIEYGSTSKDIAKVLYENNLIKSKILFNLFIDYFKYDKTLKAGYYEISPERNIFEIIDIITKGRVATYKITIPEGSTVREIAKIISKKSFYSEDEFLETARTIKLKKSYLKDNSNLLFKVEGFLYPDTYHLPKNYNPAQIYKTMISSFENKWLNRLNKLADESDFTILDYITIASLVEKEAKLDEEKRIIAGVIFNRLNSNMKLQIDATIQYSLPVRKERLLYSDLEVDSSYNTYQNSGLPPGPIANPGGKSIQAVLNPKDTDYLFYFAKKDGSHVFSENYEEHLRKQRELN
ncbi:MAG: endolytic transglycosylase MltG [Bacillota bacterium]